MASFRKRGKSWQYRIVIKDPYADKQKEYSKSGFATKKEAQLAAAKREKSVLAGYEQGDMLFATYARDWLEQYVKDKLRPNTYKTYKTVIENHAIPYFGSILLKDIRPMMYQKFIDGLLEKNLSTETARRVHNVCFQVLKRAVMNHYIEMNPAEHVRIKKKAVKKLKFLEPSYLPAFYKEAYKRGHIYGIFFKCLFESGLRKGEAAALKWSDVDWKEETLLITQTLDFQPDDRKKLFGPVKKDSSVRVIKMRHSFIGELQEHLKYQNQRKLYLGDAYRHDLNLIFCREDGTPLPKSTLYNVFKACLEKIGASPLPIHSTRHTHAVMLLEAEADMKYIQERLGHGSFEVTSDTYSHVSKKIEGRSIEKFEGYMKSFEN